MKIFVTGSSGFIGSFLCESLNKAGHEVYCLTRTIEKFKRFSIKGIPIVGELSTSAPNSWIYEVPKDIDVVVHLAGIVHSYKPADFYKVNAEATRILVDDLKSHNPHLKFILISSLAASGPSQKGIKKKENDQEGPVSHYGKSKLAAESYLQNLGKDSWKKVVVRPPVVIGPRDPAMLEVFKMVKSGLVLISGTDGLTKRYSFVSVHDLVAGIQRITEQEIKSNWDIFFFAHHKSFSFDELIKEISSIFNEKKFYKLFLPYFFIHIVAWCAYIVSKFFPLDFRLTPDKTRELIPSCWEVDSEKSIIELGTDYKDSLQVSLKKAFTDYQDRSWL
ncbi:MAG: NAD-dependent epimerase/dehydratase family protein [Bacteriovoracaceae bacterium]